MRIVWNFVLNSFLYLLFLLVHMFPSLYGWINSTYFSFENYSRRSAMYQSTGSLHSDGHSSNSMSPAPSPWAFPNQEYIYQENGRITQFVYSTKLLKNRNK